MQFEPDLVAGKKEVAIRIVNTDVEIPTKDVDVILSTSAQDLDKEFIDEKWEVTKTTQKMLNKITWINKKIFHKGKINLFDSRDVVTIMDYEKDKWQFFKKSATSTLSKIFFSAFSSVVFLFLGSALLAFILYTSNANGLTYLEMLKYVYQNDLMKFFILVSFFTFWADAFKFVFKFFSRYLNVFKYVNTPEYKEVKKIYEQISSSNIPDLEDFSLLGVPGEKKIL